MHERTVIIGAGPAGIRAAETLVRHGVRPILIDEAPRWGGQIFRQQPANFRRTPEQLYGFDAPRASGLAQTFQQIAHQIDYHPDTLVWNVEPGRLDLLHQGQSRSQPWSSLIVASGATERILPFPGWTLPGIYGLGAAQVALKFQACAIGSQVVLAGTGPLLYLVAYQYVKAGANVVAVLDTAPRRARFKAIPGLLAQPRQLARGLYYIGWLKSRSIPLHTGIRILRAHGQTRIESLEFKDSQSSTRTIRCDALGFGYGLRAETQIADLLSCRFEYNPLQRAHLPVKDSSGQTSVSGVYLAGDGAGIMGAEAAELSGERSALALLIKNGHCSALDSTIAARIQTLESKLAAISRFRTGLEAAFPCPDDWVELLDDKTLVCRCEEITLGDMKQAFRDSNIREINRMKALSRVGMGRCQARMCGHAASEILAHLSGQPHQDVGRLRGQPPVKPVPAHAIALDDGSEDAA